jgi:hypothetical protein
MRLSYALVVLLIPLAAAADEFHTLVSYVCDVKGDQLVIEYKGAYNEAGEALIESKGENAWSPSHLRGLRPDHPTFSMPKTVIRSCGLSDGSYVFKLKPVPEDLRNVQGRCGDWETASFQVQRGQQTVAEVQFDQSCYDSTAPVVTKVIVKARQKAPDIKSVSSNAFYR